MKKSVFLLLFLCGLIQARSTDFVYTEEYDHMLFNEWAKEELKQLGFETSLLFAGNSHFTTTFINQSNQGDLESQVCTYQGNVDFRFHDTTNDFGYGFESCTKQNSGLIKQGNPIFDTAFIFFESDYIGQFRLGYTNTASDNFTIGGCSVFKGYEGPASCYLGVFYNNSAGSIISYGFEADDNKAAKIAWYSPIIKGFSFGVSFTPNTRYSNLFKQRNSVANNANNGGWDFSHTSAYSKNVITIAGKYEYGQQSGFNATISAFSWFGEGKSGDKSFQVKNIRAYGLGGIFGYKDFKFALGYINNGKSLLSKSYATRDATSFDESVNYSLTDPSVGIKSGANAGETYSCGVSYDFDRTTAYAGYIRSEVKFSSQKSEKAIADIIVAGAEYNLTKAISAYVEYNNIISKTCDRARAYKKACGLSSTGNNRANMVMIGTKLVF